MSSRASAGPQEPCGYDMTFGGLASSGPATSHTAAKPSGRVNSDRSPSSTSWISRTYGGSGSAPLRSDSGIEASALSSASPGPAWTRTLTAPAGAVPLAATRIHWLPTCSRNTAKTD